MKKINACLLLFLLTLTQCYPDLDVFKPSSADVNFETYMAIGNSVSAGYANDALYKERQIYSFPNILAQQLESVGRKGEFKQPYLDYPDGIGLTVVNKLPRLNTRFVLKTGKNCKEESMLIPQPIDPHPNEFKLFEILLKNIYHLGPFHNQAVPGVKVTNIAQKAYAIENPYFQRITEIGKESAPIDHYRAVQPTFFSLFLGANDVLLYASAGGTSGKITPIQGGIGVGFDASYRNILDTLKAVGKYKDGKMQGILCSVPSITYTPFFNTMKPDLIELENDQDVKALNSHYTRYNRVMDSLGLKYRIDFKKGNNYAVIEDPEIMVPAGLEEYKIRQITGTEFLLLDLPGDSVLCSTWGSYTPIGDRYSLRQSQADSVTQAIKGYNETIYSLAQEHDLAFFNLDDFLEPAHTIGVTIDGILFTTDFVTGNIFGLDGIHLTPQGNALFARYLIDRINSKYNTKIPKPSPSLFPAVVFP